MTYGERTVHAIESLDRMNNWISECDNKAGTVLGILGVMMTIILTSDGLKAIRGIWLACLKDITFCKVLYLLSFVSAVILMMKGCFDFISVLFARISPEQHAALGTIQDSKVFFGTIAANATFDDYLQKVEKLDEEQYWREIESQVYINSKIARKKYKLFNSGFKLSLIGFGAFAAIVLIGLILY